MKDKRHVLLCNNIKHRRHVKLHLYVSGVNHFSCFSLPQHTHTHHPSDQCGCHNWDWHVSQIIYDYDSAF